MLKMPKLMRRVVTCIKWYWATAQQQQMAMPMITATYYRQNSRISHTFSIPKNAQPKVKSSPIGIVKRVANFQFSFSSPFFYYYFQCSTHVNTTIFRYGLNIAFCSDFFLRTLCMSADSRTIFLPKRGRLIDILCWNSVFGVKTTTLYFDSIAPFNAYSRLKSSLNENPKVIR